MNKLKDGLWRVYGGDKRRALLVAEKRMFERDGVSLDEVKDVFGVLADVFNKQECKALKDMLAGYTRGTK